MKSKKSQYLFIQFINKQAGFSSIREFAEACDTLPQSIYKSLNGWAMQKRTVEKWAKILNCSPEDIKNKIWEEQQL